MSEIGIFLGIDSFISKGLKFHRKAPFSCQKGKRMCYRLSEDYKVLPIQVFQPATCGLPNVVPLHICIVVFLLCNTRSAPHGIFCETETNFITQLKNLLSKNTSMEIKKRRHVATELRLGKFKISSLCGSISHHN